MCVIFESIRITLHPINCSAIAVHQPCRQYGDHCERLNVVDRQTDWTGRDEKHSPGDPSAEGIGDCGEVRDNASDFIAGEVAMPLTSRIRHHLRFWNDCDGSMTSLAQTVGLARRAPQHNVPDSLKEKLKNIPDD
jgi:hypothetical protein